MTLALFILVAVAALIALIALLAPAALRRPHTGDDDSLAQDLRESLSEIDAAETRAHLDAGEAGAARTALKRAALRQLDRGTQTGISRPARFASLVFLGLAPLFAFGLYWQVGAPIALYDPARDAASSADLPADSPAAALAALPPEEREAQIRAMVEGLAARLREEPGDIDGLRMLARAQTVLGRHAEARATFGTLFAQIPGDADDWRDYAGLFVAEAGPGAFPVAPEFLRALAELEKRAPEDGFALFFRGGAARAQGDSAAALSAWRRLLATIPETEPARARLEALIAETEGSPK